MKGFVFYYYIIIINFVDEEWEMNLVKGGENVILCLLIY